MLEEDDDDIRRGIVDLSSLIATSLAASLAFVVGIFLTLSSPFLRAVRLIAGDVRGLLGDLGILHELEGLWRMCRNMRRRGMGGSRAGYDDCGRRRGRSNDHRRVVAVDDEDCRYRTARAYRDDESANTDGSTVHTPQFVGGWRPSVCPSVASGGSGASIAAVVPPPPSPHWRGEEGHAASSSSRSYSSLPLYQDDPYQRGCHSNHQAQQEVSSCPPIVQKNPRQGDAKLFYAAGGCGSAYERRPTANATSGMTTERSRYYDDDYAVSYSKTTTRSPMKPSRRPLAGAGNRHFGSPHMRSRSSVV